MVKKDEKEKNEKNEKVEKKEKKRAFLKQFESPSMDLKLFSHSKF